MKKMKLFLVVIFFMTLNVGFSQNNRQNEQSNLTYKILNPESVDNISSYVIALDKSDLTSNRLRNKNVIIKFETGLEVEIFSAQFLSDQNLLANDISFYLEDFGKSTRPIFKLGDNDFIIELHSIQEKK